MSKSPEKEKRTGSFYSTSYGERRKKRHAKGQTRMKVLLAILVLLVIVWLFLPHPTGDTTASDPNERTREFPVTETPIPESKVDLGAQDGFAELPPEAIAPNPLLEGYVEQELRESPYTFDITYPNKEARLTEQPDGTHLFRLAGRLSINVVSEEGTTTSAPTASEDEAPDIPAFRVHLFSNKPEDYESFQPIFTEDIIFQVEGNVYVFQLSHPEELDPGLYYYLIEATESGEAFYVGKVSVAG